MLSEIECEAFDLLDEAIERLRLHHAVGDLADRVDAVKRAAARRRGDARSNEGTTCER